MSRAERGFSLSRGSAEHGFTLIEMLVALAIFSLAALALLRLEGATVASASLLERQAIAQIVARNIAVETMTDPQPPALGAVQGQAGNGGHQWRWTRVTALSPEPRIQQIVVRVAEVDGPAAASLTFFRRGEG